MRQTVTCPEWEYANHPRRNTLVSKVARVLVRLRRGQIETLEHCEDTRPIHEEFFLELTPPGFEYYAGHYRGEDFLCLRAYQVTVGSDPRVGFAASVVPEEMSHVARRMRSGMGGLDAAHRYPHAQIPADIKLLHTVMFACQILELFLRVHPYANGNGHVGRFLVWAILGRYGYWPRQWSVEPRPPDPPYTQLIVEYRNGNPEPLEEFVLQCIVGS